MLNRLAHAGRFSRAAAADQPSRSHRIEVTRRCRF